MQLRYKRFDLAAEKFKERRNFWTHITRLGSTLSAVFLLVVLAADAWSHGRILETNVARIILWVLYGALVLALFGAKRYSKG